MRDQDSDDQLDEVWDAARSLAAYFPGVPLRNVTHSGRLECLTIEVPESGARAAVVATYVGEAGGRKTYRADVAVAELLDGFRRDWTIPADLAHPDSDDYGDDLVFDIYETLEGTFNWASPQDESSSYESD